MFKIYKPTDAVERLYIFSLLYRLKLNELPQGLIKLLYIQIKKNKKFYIFYK